jgi:two-component system chemotaxis response regulator CheB
MFSTLTQRGGAATLDALALGADDYVTKPSADGGLAGSLQQVREQLLPKVKALAARAQRGRSLFLPPPRTAPSLAPRPRVNVVALGVSTGGPNALAALLPELPADLPVPVLIVQHMPALFTRLLADRLATKCALRVKEAEAGDAITPGRALLAPGDFHLTVARGPAGVQAQLSQGPPENSCRPAVDVLFRSVAAAYGPGALAVVMTGMGQDGLRGSECVREAGGRVLAQDEASSVVWGMPGFVTRAGLADRVLPLPELGQEIVRRVCRAP